MKKVNFIMTCIAALMFAACGGNNAPTTKEGAHQEHTEGEGHGHEVYYTCTDHQDVHEHAAGKCPKCQKDLVKIEDAGHAHDTYYTCTMHPEVHEHEAGKCPKCQMDLVKKEGEKH
ncbi:MAG: heavy metal-binding domain-containing protein [Flavobacteriales bacterium]|nr:heavy metal-binding domain-containing protein [Flavobacteriales bacterium]